MDRLNKNRLRREVLKSLEGGRHPTDEEVYREIDRVILRCGRDSCDSIGVKRTLREQVFHAIRGFDILEQYLKDDSITEIMVVGESKIFIERCGQIEKTDMQFESAEEVYRLIDQMVSPMNRIVNASTPIADCHLPDGSRVHIVLPPVSLVGPVITIRKFPKEGMTMEKLVHYGAFPALVAKLLGCLVRARYNILVSGATNSGKSSLLNAMAGFIPEGERVIVIEDSAELQFFQVDNLVRLETRTANIEGKNEITMQDLIKASLRMRPDRIIVGEVRGGEAVSMLQALSTGHSGSFSTIHANSCKDALKRLETMVLMGMDIPLQAVQGQIVSSLDILIHLGRLRDGSRRLLEMYEVCGFAADYQLNPLFSSEYTGESRRLLCRNHIIKDGKLKSSGQYEAYRKVIQELQEAP